MKKISFLFLFVSFALFAASPEPEVYQKLETFSKVLSYVESNYINEVKTSALIEDAIKGMLQGLDPHTVYLPADLHQEIKEDTSGAFEGLGLEMTVKEGVLSVVTAIEGTPAFEKLKSGDQILKIDGQPTQDMSLADAVKKMRGPQGSKVQLLISREQMSQPFEVVLKRQKIVMSSVESELKDDAYAYIKIKSFQENTEEDLKNHLKKMTTHVLGHQKTLKGIVLDLRNNPGGLLDQAVRVADVFLEEGVIVSTQGRKGNFKEQKLAQKSGTELNLPMITLINGGSASAAEIVAGALQDHRKSVISGEQSFGKGSVQTIIDLEDGSALKLTIADYYTPSGRSIQAQGITPDIFISPLVAVNKAQTREKDLKGHLEKVGQSKPKDGFERSSKDIQLERSLEYLKTWYVFKNTVVSP